MLENILNGPRGNLNGPFLGWIYSPELADHAQRLGAFCRYETGLSLKLSELAILVTASQWRAQAEWHIHCPIAVNAGLDSAIADAILKGKKSNFSDAEEAVVYTFASELHEHRRVSDSTYRSAIQAFGLEKVVNLVALLGYYTLVAMTLNTFNMLADKQVERSFPE